MKKTFALFAQGFQSSSGLTPEFAEFAKTFKKEFTATLKKRGCHTVEISRGHFYMYGFFTTEHGVIYYFNTGDVRWSAKKLMYREADHYQDWTGKQNQHVDFKDGFVSRMVLRGTNDIARMAQ